MNILLFQLIDESKIHVRLSELADQDHVTYVRMLIYNLETLLATMNCIAYLFY